MGQLSVIHVHPLDPAKAVAREETVEALADMDMAIRILQGVNAAGKAPDLSPLDAAREAIALHKAVIDQKEQLTNLHKQADQLAIWGNTSLKTLTALRDMNLDIQFYLVPQEDLAELKAECLEVLNEDTPRRTHRCRGSHG